MIEAAVAALGPWRSPALAFAVALVAALAARAAPRLTGGAAALGLVAGLFDVFGVMIVTPRMLPERLPWLVLAAAVAGAALAPVRLGRHGRTMMRAVLLAAATWWLTGAPRTGADLRQVAPVAAAVAAGFAVALAQWRREDGLRPAARGFVAAAAMATGLLLAGAPMLFVGLAACGAAAAAGTLIGAGGRAGARIGDLGTLPLIAAIAGAGTTAALAWPDRAVIVAAALPLLVLAVPWPQRRENAF